MSAAVVVNRFRRLLLILSACLCVGTIVELRLRDHIKEPPQLIPFGLCAAGLIVILAVLIRPDRNTIRALRVLMAFLVIGSVLGVYFHLQNNFELELEMRPGASPGDVVMQALTGASPLLAPGILALAAVLAIAGTYYHPALGWAES
jgi:hypothetical protein